eukprot:m.117589 g.117589  ORF g.117589 m.117589 type:complete len:591 (-) comp12877_c3_seq1:1578-3350(-)
MSCLTVMRGQLCWCVVGLVVSLLLSLQWYPYLHLPTAPARKKAVLPVRVPNVVTSSSSSSFSSNVHERINPRVSGLKVRVFPVCGEDKEKQHIGYSGDTAIAMLREAVDTMNEMEASQLQTIVAVVGGDERNESSDLLTSLVHNQRPAWDLLWTFSPQEHLMTTCDEKNGVVSDNHVKHQLLTTDEVQSMVKEYNQRPVLNHCFLNYVHNIAGLKSAQFALYEGMKLSSEENMDQYSFIPDTITLPRPLLSLQAWLRRREDGSVWVFKPDAGRGGVGVSLFSLEELQANKTLLHSLCQEAGVLQRYVERPLLVDGYKHHLRVYLVTTSVFPLQAYLHAEGLYLPSQKPFVWGKWSDMDVHLTNGGRRSIPNPCGDAYENNDTIFHPSCSQRLSMYWDYLRTNGGMSTEMIAKIKNRIVASLLSLLKTSPSIAKKPVGSSCFRCVEVYGVDILLSHSPNNVIDVSVLEVNHAPELWTPHRHPNQQVHNELIASTIQHLQLPVIREVDVPRAVLDTVKECADVHGMDGINKFKLSTTTTVGLCAQAILSAYNKGPFVPVSNMDDECSPYQSNTKHILKSFLCCCHNHVEKTP